MGIVLALLSSMCGGAADFLGGVTTKRMPAVMVVAVSQFVAMLALVILALIAQPTIHDWSFLWWGALAGLSMNVALVAFYSALATGTMGVVAPIGALSAVIPLLWGILVLGEAPGVVKTGGLVLTILAVVLVSGPEVSRRLPARPLLLAVGAALSFGVLGVLMASVARSNLVLGSLTLKCSIVAGLLPLVARSAREMAGISWGPVALPLVAIGLLDVTATLALAKGLTMGYVSVVSVVASLFPLYTVLLGRIYLDERLMRIQQVGIVTIVAGLGLIAAG